MIYIFDTELIENKLVCYALKQIYGIGEKRSNFICKKLGFSYNLKVKNLSKDQITELLKLIDGLNLILASDLKKLKFLSIKNLISIKSYRGFRRNQGLPLRGQRTHTNAKTARKKSL
uniref:Small ribosomal subunit protein uS13m n=1 Tax=Pleurosigma intermedium TaxID=197753 RepID=A0A8F9R3K6_9STRA|nr:ribosomal protein S13 [Pleurosigma sp. mgcode 4]